MPGRFCAGQTARHTVGATAHEPSGPNDWQNCPTGTHQPDRLTPRDAATGQPSGQLSLIPISSLYPLLSALAGRLYARLVRDRCGIWAALSGVDGGSDKQKLALAVKNLNILCKNLRK
jgi:hypothetical protein